jgi:hypothetical protein
MTAKRTKKAGGKSNKAAARKQLKPKRRTRAGSIKAAQVDARATRQGLLDQITNFYLGSRDWNGLPLRSVTEPTSRVRTMAASLIRAGDISIECGDRHPNPHIKSFEPEATDVQMAKARRLPLENICAYPTPQRLGLVVDRAKYSDRPFTLPRLAAQAQRRGRCLILRT